ncbi:putative peroxidase 26 [Platanthera guangdongensis]|uniref:Peroxidase n=1 Tax=Platanthera guangdongensis TaxID=2320717 RepID=A0ABR2LRM0_9ASPA
MRANGFKVVDDIKKVMEARCLGVVTCADILNLAAKEAVALAALPKYPVYIGRRDDATSTKKSVDLSPPDVTWENATCLNAEFSARAELGTDFSYWNRTKERRYLKFATLPPTPALPYLPTASISSLPEGSEALAASHHSSRRKRSERRSVQVRFSSPTPALPYLFDLLSRTEAKLPPPAIGLRLLLLDLVLRTLPSFLNRVCPDGAIVANAWKLQLAGQASASVVDRTSHLVSEYEDELEIMKTMIHEIETPWLDNRHVVFGHVIEGIKVLKKLESQETSRADVPKLPCRIVNSGELPSDS